MEERISMMATLEIRTASPFKDLFPIKETVLNEIAEDMKQNGYDYAHPIIIWAGHKVTVVDGHTRLKAALKIGLSKVPITLKEFANEDEALQYAIRSQSNRRNLTDAELLNCITQLDKRNAVGRPSKIPPRGGISGGSAEHTAGLLGISRTKVERLRTVHDHATDKIKNAVASGKMSVNKAYNETMAARRAAAEKTSAPTAEKTAAEIKAERSQALVKSITEIVKNRLVRECQEYSEVTYSQQEKAEINAQLSAKITDLVSTMLSGENENAK